MPTQPRSTSALPLAAAVVSPILSSVAWLTQGEAIRLLSPEALLAFSPLLASLILGSYLAMRGELPTLASLRSFSRPLAYLYVTRYLGAAIIFCYALLYTDAAKVMFLTKVEPYLVVFWCWMLQQQRVKANHLLLLGVHIAGALVLSTGGKFQIGLDQLGDLLVLIATACSALSYIPAAQLSSALGSIQVSFVCQALSALIFIPFGFCIGALQRDLQSDALAAGALQIVWTVLLFNISSHVLWYYSLRGARAWLISALRCLGPIVAAPIAWLAFDQPLSTAQLCGAAVVLATSVLMVKAREEG